MEKLFVSAVPPKVTLSFGGIGMMPFISQPDLTCLDDVFQAGNVVHNTDNGQIFHKTTQLPAFRRNLSKAFQPGPREVDMLFADEVLEVSLDGEAISLLTKRRFRMSSSLRYSRIVLRISLATMSRFICAMLVFRLLLSQVELSVFRQFF